MDASLFLQNVNNNLSGKQKNHLKKLEKIIQTPIALGLLSMQPTASANEIDMIAEMLSLFLNVEIYSARTNPRQVVFEGLHNNACIRIHPQYIIKKPKDHPHHSGKKDSPSNYWAIDLAIELLFNNFRLAVLGIEYDGHAAHYVESNIKRSHIRDWGIFSAEGFTPLRISPDQWKIHLEWYKKTILKHLDREIKKYYSPISKEMIDFNREQDSVPDFIIQKNGASFFAIPLTRDLIEGDAFE